MYNFQDGEDTQTYADARKPSLQVTPTTLADKQNNKQPLTATTPPPY